MIDIDILRNIEEEEGVSKDYIIEVIQAALQAAYRKTFNEQNSIVKIDLSRGSVKIYSEKTIVESVENPVLEVNAEEAKKFTDNVEIGGTVLIEIPVSRLSSTAIRTARQVFQQKILERKREVAFEEFSGLVGTVVTGRVTRKKGRGEIGVNIEPHNIEGVITPEEAIPGEQLRKDRLVKALIKEVSSSVKGPQIILSRACPEFLERLVNMEVPEVQQGIVEIKGIAREPGVRTKMAVATKNLRVDPVGACIGTKGVRINAVSRELNRERIDVIRYNTNPAIYIENALSPGKVERVEIIPKTTEANVYVSSKNYPSTLGGGGINVKLASNLTGYRIHLIELLEESGASEQK
jgi:N utilization substance protein A